MSADVGLITQWRSENPDVRITATVICKILGLSELPSSDLRCADLRGTDLRGTDLRGADLRGASLRNSNLRSADLRGADLRDASLRNSNLRSADLRGATCASADLRNSDLRYADLCRCNLTGAYLRNSDLRYAHLDGADLTGADLRRCNLRYAHLDGADLRPVEPSSITAFTTPSGRGWIAPTPDGWQVSIGCWKFHTLDDLRALVKAPDTEWPEARGEECARRRPVLRGLLAWLEAHATYYAKDVAQLRERWVA